MKRIDNINFKYVPAAKTNILETLKRAGFEPPSESAWYQEKWKRYRHVIAINESR